MSFSASRKTYRIILIYIILGTAWILFSDFAVDYLNDQGLSFKHIQTLKGTAFILVTAVLLYFILHHNFKEIQAAWGVQAESEKRYRTAFEHAPHPLWEVDLSELKTYIDEQSPSSRFSLKEQVAKSPELRERFLSMIHVTKVNECVYKLFGDTIQEEVIPPCAALFQDKEYTFLRKELEALAERKREFQTLQYVLPDGWTKEVALNIHWMVLPGHEENYERVLISAFDITSMETMLEKLKVSETKYKKLVENTSEAVLVCDLKRLYFSNRKAEDLFGITSEGLRKASPFNFVCRDDRQAFLDIFHQCLTEKKSCGHVCRVLDQNGDIHWVELRLSITPWEENTAVLILILDITQRVTHENQLRQAKLLFEKVFNSLNEAIFLIDVENRKIVVCNPAVEKIFGYRRKELNGRSARQLHVSDETFARFGELSELVLAKGEVFHTSYIMRHKDGHEVYTENTVTPIDDLAGWTHGVISVVRDVTAQKRFEQELRASEMKYERLLEDAKEGIVILQNECISYVNRRMEEILGFKREELLGSPYLDYIHTDERQEVIGLYQTVMTEGAFPPDTEIGVLDRQNEVRWLRVNAVKAEWEYKPAVMALVMDISEQKALKEKNEEMEARVLQAQKMESIGTLAGGIAHDFNNILSAVLGYTELAMAKAEKDTALGNELKEVYSAGIRAKELVKQILTFSRLSDYEFQPMQISTIIKEVVKFLRSSIPASIHLELDIRSESMIMGDPTQIHQVIMNLCTNGVQAMPENKGKVQVSVKDVVLTADHSLSAELPMGNYVQVEIADDGAGIAPEHINQIFEPYFTTKQVGEGTGLGLSLVYGIIESYGGKITVQSQQGEGTIFTMLFPRVREEIHREIEGEKEIPTGHERILVVDDEISIVKMLERQLVNLGYSVTTRTNSVDALNLFSSQPLEFDLLLTDMTMPNMTGEELAAEISSIRPDLPRIICTGFSRKTSDWISSDLPADEVLYKPVAIADLARVIRRLLDKTAAKERLA